MKKKEYIIPEVEVVKIQNMQLLSGSVSSDDIDWGGNGDDVVPGAPLGLPGLPDSPLGITPEKLLGFPF